MKKMLQTIQVLFFALLCSSVFADSQPTITAVTPSLNATGQSVSTSIDIVFSESMDETSLTSSTIKIYGNFTGYHSGSISYSSGSMTATFDPTTDFEAGEVITVTVTTGVKNASGVAIANAYSWNFTTATSPKGDSYSSSSYTVGYGPREVRVADVDNDGDNDLVTVNYDWDNASVLKNNGDGTFGTKTDYPLGDNPTQIIVADVNNDTYMDIISTNSFGLSLSVLINNSNGTFAAKVDYATPFQSRSLISSDVNGDGYLDLLAPTESKDSVSVFMNNGDGTFADDIQYFTGDGPFGITAADVDGDGDMDLITSNYATSTVSVLPNLGDGTFGSKTDYSTGNQPRHLTTGDVDGDGDADLIVAIFTGPSTGNVAVFKNNGDGTFAPRVDYTTAYGAFYPVASDVDGDGDIDILCANSAPGNIFSLFDNNGDGTFAEKVDLVTGTTIYGGTAADLDGNGTVDFVYGVGSSNQVTVKLNIVPPSVSSTAPTSHTTDASVSEDISITFDQAMFADSLNARTIVVNGSQSGLISGSISYNSGTYSATFNPTNDFAVGEVVTVTVTTSAQNAQRAGLTSPYSFQFTTYRKGDILSDQNTTLKPGGKPNMVIHTDIDDDGDLDMIFSNAEKDSLTILTNNGSGTYSSPNQLYAGSGTYPSSVSAGDFNKDGMVDLVVTNYLTNAIEVYLNTGSLAFSRTTYGTQNGPIRSAVADFDGDGDLDVATYNRLGISISVLMNNGNGTFASAGNQSLFASSMNVIKAADMDSDGDIDLLIGGEHQTVYLMKNNGNGTFATEVNLGFSSVSDFELADLNDDGNLDLISVHQNADRVTLSINNGDGTFASGTNFTYESPTSVTMMDLGGDQDYDILVSFLDTYTYEGDGYDEIGYLTNNGSGIFTSEKGFKVDDWGSYFGYITLSTADVDSDGDLDLIQTSRLNSSVYLNKSADYVTVSTFTPAPNSFDASPSASITATLNYDADPVTINSSTVTLVGSGSGRVAGSISYDSPTRTITFDPTQDLKPGQTYMLSVSDSVSSEIGVKLYSGKSTEFTVATSGTGNGHFSQTDTISFDSGIYPDQSAIGDLNGDGYQDLVVTTGYYGTGYILLNNGDGTYAAPTSLGYSKSYISNLVLADMDGDSDLDIIIGRSGNSHLDVLTNDGSASFTETVSYGSYQTYYDNLYAKDLSSDGLPDLIQRYSGSSGPTFYINKGDGNFIGDIKQIDWSSSGLVITDLDSDGDQDFIMSYSQNGASQLGISLNEKPNAEGLQLFGEPYFIDTDIAPKLINAADFDNDGDVDFVASTSDGLSFFIIKNNGNGSFTTQSALPVEYEIASIQTGDLNGDGDIDLVFKSNEADDNGASYVMTFYNSGNGTFPGSASFPIPGNYFKSVNLADVDSDGDLDFAAVYGYYAGPDYVVKVGIFENTVSVVPTTAASNVSSSLNLGSKITLNWTKGDGTRSLVVLKAGGPVDATPVNNGNYTPGSEFGTGSDLGSGNFVVFAGGGKTVTVSGLSLDTDYHVAVFTFNGNEGDESFYTTDAPISSFTTNAENGYPFDTTPGTALSFNGSSSVAEFSYQNELPKDITFQMWVKIADSSDVAAFFVRGDSQGVSEGGEERVKNPDNNPDKADRAKPISGITAFGESEYYYPIHLGINDGHLYASIYDDDEGDPVNMIGTDVVKSNQWYHVALTMHRDDEDYANGTFYVNGNSVGTYSGVYYNDYDYSFVLGYDGEDYFEGVIDELQIRDKVLTTQEIRAGMHTTLSGFPENMLGYWQFNDGSGTTASQLINNQLFYLEDVSWVTSGAPIGEGSSTVTTGVTSGEQTVGNATLNISDGFDNPVDVVVSEVTAEPNAWPEGYSSSVGGKYFVIELFGEPGTFSVDLTLNFGANVLDELVNEFPQTIKLYKRSSTSSGEWTDLGGATSADYVTGDVTWTGITSFSQFLPVYDESTVPVELSAFSATPEDGKIRLTWTATTETNNAGWEVQRKKTEVRSQKSEKWEEAGFVAGKGTTTEAHSYEFVVSDVAAGKLEFRLKQIDMDGTVSYSRILSVDLKPTVFALEQNFPNPFNPTTVIRYQLPVNSKVNLKVYDITGRLVTTLVDGPVEAGVHSVSFNANGLASGVYFYKIQAGTFQSVKKFTLLK